jgi:hypothetical protein
VNKILLNEIWNQENTKGNGFPVGDEHDNINEIVAAGLTLVSPAERSDDIAVYVTDAGKWIGVGGDGCFRMPWAIMLETK